jgi:hypothetical protein
MHKRYLPCSPSAGQEALDAQAMAVIELATAPPEVRAAKREALKAAGSTKRGVPVDYQGDDPALCNVPTRSGRSCRALGLGSSGRCKIHGGVEDERQPDSRGLAKLDPTFEQALLRAHVRLRIKEIASRRRG